MEEKCPCCGELNTDIPQNAFWVCGYCQFMCDKRQFIRIAAAAELAMAAVWANECEAQREYMDDTTSNRDAWRSIINLDLEANEKAHDALGRVLEVFGGE